MKAPIRLCFDRIIAADRKIAAARLAVDENPKNAPDEAAVRAERRPGASFHPMKLALLTGKRWANFAAGKTLKVLFLDGSDVQKAKTRQFAVEWCDYANVKFDFNGGSDAEIRVSFKTDPGSSWSAVGTDCLSRPDFPLGQPTMNFGWLEEDTEDVEWRRVVVHEFGHALGCIHEHSNPKGGIRWNLPAVYKYFSGPPNNWSKEEIDSNVIEKYSIDQLNASKFDRKSIMLYQFPGALIVGGVATPLNTDLSAMDKKFIAEWYPKRARKHATVRNGSGKMQGAAAR